MNLRVMVQNLSLGALYDGDGGPCDRWPLHAERINAVRPDLLLACEVVDWHRWGHKQLGRAMADLAMDACPLPPSGSGIGTALLYRKETVGRWVRWNTDFSQQTVHGFGVATFDLGLSSPVAFVAAHLDPHSIHQAVIEAKLIGTRAQKYGPFGLVGGDVNYPPAHGPDPDMSEAKPFNIGARWRLPGPDEGGRLVPDRRVGLMLEHTGLVDTAWHLYEQTGEAELLARTAAMERVDQVWVTGALAPAVLTYRRLPGGAASDHDGLLVTLDLGLLAESAQG